MLIDDITIRVRAGNGGNGAVAFNKNLHQYGPAGGSGGLGGSVYIEGSSDLGILRTFRFKKEFAANNGQDGRGQFCDGIDADDLILKVPVGTVVHNLTTKHDLEVVKVGERIRIAKGGWGGRGNFHFRSSTNTRPKRAEIGRAGENFTLRLELKLIADVGFVGLPNAGKTSLLNEFTNAKSRVGNYAFTTLEPNLGVYYGLILADIPGLIEGASSGRGLGIKFLRHVERIGVLFHVISAESEDSSADYQIIRKELGEYNTLLLKKKEYIFLNKCDMISPAEQKKKLASLKKIHPAVFACSIHDVKSLDVIRSILQKCIDEKTVAG